MKLKLLVTTDIHGNIFPTNYTTKDNIENFGLARIVSAIKKMRKEHPNLILIDNGDAFQGSPLMTYALDHNYKNPITEVFNMIGYDYFNLGNHDFNYGQKILWDYIQENNAKLLTQNIFYKDKPLGSMEILEIEDKKIAFIGVTTHYIPNWEKPSHIENFSFDDALTSLQNTVDHIKASVDFVIGIYHGGLEKDPKTHIPTEMLTGENQGFDMSQIEGLDILLTGHQHRTLNLNLFDTVITQTAHKAEAFALVTVDLETGDITSELISSKAYEPDQEVLNHFETLQNKTQDWLDQDVGSLKDHDLLVEDGFEARLHKHPLISFLNQVQLESTGADISCIALFNDAKGFNQNITNRDLVSTYVYPNTMVVKKMDGKTLKDMIDYASMYFDVDEKGNVKVRDHYAYPKPQHYNYDMFDGISYTIKASNERGSRILDLMYQGSPIEDDQIFKVVMNNYRAMGGGDYDMALNAKTLQTYQDEMIEVLSDYFKKHSPVSIKHEDNIHVIP